MTEPWFPYSADLGIVLGVFISLWCLFDLIFVRWLKFGMVAWKKTEYVCLAFAAVGIFGAVSQVRISVAQSQMGLFEQRARISFEALKSLSQSYSKSPGAVCRTFIRSEYSPPPDQFARSQREYDGVCDWYKRIDSQIPASMPSPPVIISANTFLPRPTASTADLKDIVDGVYFQLNIYNENVEKVTKLKKKTDHDTFDDAIMLLGPYFLSIALALSFAKVTGEIKLESQRNRV